VGDQIVDRSAVVDKRSPQVKGKNSLKIFDVLRPERLVEAVIGAKNF